MRQRDDTRIDPTRLRLAHQVIAECERLRLQLWADRGNAIVTGPDLEDPPAEWDRVVTALSLELVSLIDRRASFICLVERLTGGCRLYRPDWLARTETAKEPRRKCRVGQVTRYDAAPGGADRSRTGRT